MLSVYASRSTCIMPKILVTGGAGFIGSNLVNELIKLGHKVTVIDNLSAETHEHFYFNKKAKYYKYDICDYEKILPLFKKIDYVFHLAAESRIQRTIFNPRKTCLVNFYGSCNVFEAARQSKVKRVMISSTSSSYGTKNKIPYNEKMIPECLNPYSASKIGMETIAKIYWKIYGLETVIFRYFNVYGSHEALKGQYAPVIGLFLRQKKEGKPMTIVGTGKQTRDFTYVDDVVSANIKAMTAKNAVGEVFNIGSGKNYSMLEIAKMVGGDITFIPPRIGEIPDTRADNRKARRILKWKPTKKLKDYIDGNNI